MVTRLCLALVLSLLVAVSGAPAKHKLLTGVKLFNLPYALPPQRCSIQDWLKGKAVKSNILEKPDAEEDLVEDGEDPKPTTRLKNPDEKSTESITIRPVGLHSFNIKDTTYKTSYNWY